MSKQFRLRLTDVELRFLIVTLADVVESCDNLLAFARTLPRNDPRIGHERRRRFVAKELKRKFEGNLEGRKTHMRRMALLVCGMLMDEN